MPLKNFITAPTLVHPNPELGFVVEVERFNLRGKSDLVTVVGKSTKIPSMFLFLKEIFVAVDRFLEGLLPYIHEEVIHSIGDC